MQPPRLAWFVVLLSLLSGPASGSIPAFFADLWARHAEDHARLRAGEYAEFCTNLDLAPAAPANVRAFGEIVFVHELFTGSRAVDCSRGGVLQVPYFWHWVEPNPRHAIVWLPDSRPLVTVTPPADFARYRSFADIDRTPALYLADLVTASPRYRHDGCGEFYTFGWCSEREMAFLSLMICLGHQGRIRQQGIHSWSELRCRLVATNGHEVDVIATVDNTFGTLTWQRLQHPEALADWLQDIGSNRHVRWYNATARSPGQHAQLLDTVVPAAAAARIERQVGNWLRPDRPPRGGDPELEVGR
jgi:hypothetical protein